MFELDNLLLISGNNIPFPEGKLIIHQPTLREIAFIGEETFFIGCQFLNFSKKSLSEKDKLELEKVDDFDILMSMIMDKQNGDGKQQVCISAVLALMFPNYQIKFDKQGIILINEQEEGQMGIINKMNFKQFKTILVEMFCLNINKDKTTEYNPGGKLAKELADKFEERHRKLAELKNEREKGKNKIAIFARYISVLTVATHKTMNSFLDYTVYQLFDEHSRYELKNQYDIYFKARLAGAQDMEEPEDWMKDIHT